MPAKCAQCGATSDRVRLYRSYATFRRPELDRCNACLPESDTSFMVPLIFNSHGEVYGFASAPDDKVSEFMALPEKSDVHPTWTAAGWDDKPVAADRLRQELAEAEKIRLKDELVSLKLEMAAMRDRCGELRSAICELKINVTGAIIAAIALTLASNVAIICYVAANSIGAAK